MSRFKVEHREGLEGRRSRKNLPSTRSFFRGGNAADETDVASELVKAELSSSPLLKSAFFLFPFRVSQFPTGFLRTDALTDLPTAD